MYFYRIKLDEPFSISYAHGYKTHNYSMCLFANPCLLEIVYIEQGNIALQSESGEKVYHKGNIVTFVHDHELALYSTEKEHHHFSVGFTLSSAPVIMGEEEVAAWNVADNEAILPETYEGGKAVDLLETLLKKIIRCHGSIDVSRHLLCRAYLFEIFAHLTAHSKHYASAKQKASYLRENFYCQRACAYIAEHITEKIYVQDIADYAGISYGYLSTLFPENTGMTIVDYINRAKIQKVKELISASNISLARAGEAVGIEDVKYLSRLFKKFNNISVLEYRKLCNNTNWRTLQ